MFVANVIMVNKMRYKSVTAEVNHKCHGCSKDINVGDIVEIHTCISDGNICDLYICNNCIEFLNKNCNKSINEFGELKI